MQTRHLVQLFSFNLARPDQSLMVGLKASLTL